MIYDRRVPLLKLVKGVRLGCDLTPSAVYRHQPARFLPVCNVQTNLSASAVPTDFTSRLAQVLASTLNKPENVSDQFSADECLFTHGRCCQDPGLMN